MKQIYYIIAVLLLFSVWFLSCETYDYDAELNDRYLEMAELEAEDAAIREEIDAQAQKLEHDCDSLLEIVETKLKGYMGERDEQIRKKVDEAFQQLTTLISNKENDFGTNLDNYGTKLENLIKSKEGEFNQARQTLESSLLGAISSGDEANIEKLKGGIKRMDELEGKFDAAVNQVKQNVEIILDLKNKIDELEKLIVAEKQVYGKVQNAIQNFKNKMKPEIINQIQNYTTSELSALIPKFAAYVGQFEALASKVDNTWKVNLDAFIAQLDISIADFEDALQEAGEMADVVDEFNSLDDPDSVLSEIEAILQDAEEAANYDIGKVDQADTWMGQWPDVNEAYDWIDGIEDIIDDLSDAFNDIEDVYGRLW